MGDDIVDSVDFFSSFSVDAAEPSSSLASSSSPSSIGLREVIKIELIALKPDSPDLWNFATPFIKVKAPNKQIRGPGFTPKTLPVSTSRSKGRKEHSKSNFSFSPGRLLIPKAGKSHDATIK